MKQPSLIWLQWVSDLRRFRAGVVIWCLLVGLDLGLLLRGATVGAGMSEPIQVVSMVSANLVMLLLWLGIFLFPAIVITVDSPSRPDGFLKTRPMPGGQLITAKALFILVWIALPLVLSEAVHLAASYVPSGVVLHGTLERLLFVLAFTGLAAAFASLWADFRQLLIGAAIAWGTGIGGIGLWEGLGLRGAGSTALLVGTWLGVFLLLVVGWWSLRRRWRFWMKAATVGLIVMMLLPCIGLGILDFSSIQPANRTAAVETLRSVSLAIPPWNIHLPGGNQATVVIESRPSQLGLQIDWRTHRAELAGASRKATFRKPTRHTDLYASYWGNPDFDTVQAWKSLLPPETLLLSSSSPSIHRNRVSLGWLDLPAESLDFQGPVQLNAELEGHVFRWQKVAELDLEPGQQAQDSTVQWRIAEVRSARNEGFFVDLLVRRIALCTSNHPHRRRNTHAQGHYVYLLHDRQRSLVSFSGHMGYFNVVQGFHTALLQGRTTFHFQPGEFFPDFPSLADRTGLRLLILRKDYLGSERREWTSPSLDLSEFRTTETGFSSNTDEIPRNEFYRRLGHLQTPSPEGSRAAVGRYIYEVLRLVDVRDYYANEHDPLVRKLARYVPTHPEIFFQALPVSSYRSERLLEFALTQGLEESQKNMVLQALERAPALARVILNRGWEESAREALLQLADYPHRLPYSVLQGYALLKAREGYQRLLAALENNPSIALYDMVQALPGLEESLDRTVERIWKERSPILRSPNDVSRGAYSVAMRHGRRDALEKAYRLFESLDPQRRGWGSNLIDPFRKNLILSGLDPNRYYDDQEVAAWLAGHRAEEFVFDSVRRRWVLKEVKLANQTNR